MKTRIIAAAIIRNSDEYLLCRQAPDFGIFPGQWAIPGGGIEPGEHVEAGLLREISEELGDALKISTVTPWTFKEEVLTKTQRDGTVETILMIFLIYICEAENRLIKLDDEHDQHAWVPKDRIGDFDLNPTTRNTFNNLFSGER